MQDSILLPGNRDAIFMPFSFNHRFQSAIFFTNSEFRSGTVYIPLIKKTCGRIKIFMISQFFWKPLNQVAY